MRRWILRPFWRSLRFFGLWVLPPLVLALLIALGFVAWCLSSQAGTRWLLHAAVSQFDGQVQGIRGSITRGLSVDELRVAVPEAQVQVRDFHLQVLWSALRERRLQVQDLSASELDVQVQASADESPSGPFRMPALPVAVQIDRLALGRLAVQVDGQPLPVEVHDFSSALSLDAGGASLVLQQLQLVQDDTQVALQGQAALHGLAAPWPFEASLQVQAQGRSAQSPVCLQQALGGQPAGATPCQVQLQAQATGSLDALQVRATGEGEGLQLALDAQVRPRDAFPLGATQLSLGLPGKAGLELKVAPQAPDADGSRVVLTQFQAHDLNPGPWLPKDVGATLLNLDGTIQARLTGTQQLGGLSLQLDLKGPNRWNGAPLSGHVNLARLGRAQGALWDPSASGPLDPLGLTVSGLDAVLSLGPDRVEAKGDVSAAASRLSVQARVPLLKAVWPGLPGGAVLSLEGQGALARHQAKLTLDYTPEDAKAGSPGRAPLSLALDVNGGWDASQGWAGAVRQLVVQHAGLDLRSAGAVPVTLDPAGAWKVGHARLDVALQGEPLLTLDEQASSGSAGQWATRGSIPSLVVTPDRILKLQKWLGQADAAAGSVHTTLSDAARRSRLDLKLDWDLRFKGTLAGDIRLVRTSGDLTVPADVPISLGLQVARLDLAIRPSRGGTSIAHADVQIRTAKMGSLRIQADTPVHATPGGGLAISPRDVKHAQIQADSDDLAWVNLLLDESVEVRGTVHADVRGQSHPDGRWTFSGPIRGQDLNILSVDQGVRLLQGTLQAHLDGSQVVLDRLRFPAVRRVTPKEWRTATWISENPDAQGGSLDLSGDWDLYRQQGQVRVAFRRYPILQRADRYAMVTGQIDVQATLPQISVSGKVVADAGWFDLDMLNDIPSLDSDVVVLQPGKPVAPVPATPLDLAVDLTVDLGPRFYLTGYGVNSGLVGSLDLRMRQGKLTALGALRTRGGSIDVYGQHLQLRRGTVTFQGDIANPVLSIEALRTDVAVQAGVRVAGTARHPRIDLVSHPDVSETEKLTWLLLGHGPNDGGGDMSLLFSVGSSFLSGGEPFYKRFGLDELSMRSGELGATGSILPVQSVVTDLDTGASPAEQRFVVASKTLTDNVKLSLEQALAQTGTVARLSYRVLRRLQAEVTVGTVSGLALVYRWFSMD